MNWIQERYTDIKNNKAKASVLAVVIIYFIYIMIMVWKPSLLNLPNEPYYADEAYWVGLKAGMSGMAMLLGWHLLFDMTHMQPMKR